MGVGLLVAAAGLALPVVSEQWRDWATPAIAYGMAIAFAGLFAMQFIDDKLPLDNLILLAILTQLFGGLHRIDVESQLVLLSRCCS